MTGLGFGAPLAGTKIAGHCDAPIAARAVGAIGVDSHAGRWSARVPKERIVERHRSQNQLVACCLAAAAMALAIGCRRAPAPRVGGPVEVGTITVRPERVVLTTELPGRTAAYLIAE